MTIYHKLFFVLLVFGLFDLFISSPNKKLINMWVMFGFGLVIITIAGIRWDTGTDWESYEYFFRQIERRPINDSGMEIGYELIVRSFKLFFGPSYTYFLFFTSLIIVFLTYVFLFKFSPYPVYSIFLLFSYSIVSSGFGVRQDLAIAITLMSTSFIVSRSLYKFLLLILIATLIHSSTLIFLPAYWLYSFRWNVKKALILIFVLLIILVMSKYLIATFGSIIAERKVELYLEMGEELKTNPYVVLAKGMVGRLLIFSISLFILIFFSKKDPIYYGIFNLYVFGMIIYLVTTPINPIFNRLARYYDIYQIVLFPMAYFAANKALKIVTFIIISGFSIIKFNSTIKDWEGTFLPYKTIFDKH